MIRSLEIRWFFDSEPFDAREFFDVLHPPRTRTDWYAISDERCGIKLREGRFELKVLVKRHGTRHFGDIGGKIEEWVKSSLEIPAPEILPEDYLASSGWVAVEKQRYLRIFAVDNQSIVEVSDYPANGCQFEWSKLTTKKIEAWTLGFEAFGDPKLLDGHLSAVVSRVTSNKALPRSLKESLSFSYPEWLRAQPGSILRTP